MNPNRRAFLLGATALCLSASLAACAQSGASTTPTVTVDLTLASQIDAALIKIVSDVNTLEPTLVSTKTANGLIGDLTAAETTITALQGATPPPAGVPTWQTIAGWFETAVNAATPILAVTVPGAAPIIAALDAIEVLLPLFEAAITPAPTTAIALRQARIAKRPRPMVAMNQEEAAAVIKAYLAAGK
jgi:hypothetical protein